MDLYLRLYYVHLTKHGYCVFYFSGAYSPNKVCLTSTIWILDWWGFHKFIIEVSILNWMCYISSISFHARPVMHSCNSCNKAKKKVLTNEFPLSFTDQLLLLVAQAQLNFSLQYELHSRLYSRQETMILVMRSIAFLLAGEITIQIVTVVTLFLFTYLLYPWSFAE